MTNDTRVPRGNPTGGEFTEHQHDEGAPLTTLTTTVRRSTSELLRADYPQSIASNYVGERIGPEGGAGFTRADYAEVGEDGIAYGLTVNPTYLGSIVTPIGADESVDDWYDRLTEIEPGYRSALSKFLTEEYGADLMDDGGEQDNFEFYVEYEDGGPRASTIEYMGDRAENETKLLQAKNEWEYGTQMQSKLAARLGYRFELSTNGDRQVGDGSWVKNK